MKNMNISVNVIVATGGTLWQSFAWIEHCFDQTFAFLCHQYPNDPVLRRPTRNELTDMSHSGRSLDDNIAYILGQDRPEMNAEAHRKYREIHDTPEMLRAVTLYPHVRPMLTQLKNAGARLYAASEKAAGAMEASLTHLGLRPLFDHVQGVEAGVSSKGQVLEALCQHVRAKTGPVVSPDHALLLEGRPRGVAQALRETGFLSIGALWGGAVLPQMRAAGAAWVVAHPLDVVSHVGWICSRPQAAQSLRISHLEPARDPA